MMLSHGVRYTELRAVVPAADARLPSPAAGQLAVPLVSIVLVNWWSFRAVSRYLAQKRHASATPVAEEEADHPTAVASPTATESVVSAAEPTAQAFPVYGLPPGGNGASVLEGLLRRVASVSRAYVSPVTALAYVD